MRIASGSQNTAEWLDARRGKITASRIVDVLDTLKKGGEGASRRNYRMEIIAERLGGQCEDHYVSPEMVWGTVTEPEARAAYEMENGCMVEPVGLILHPSLDFTGGSPDGLVGDDGLIEIKCGKTITHLRWMMAGQVPEEHQPQILWNLCCTGRQWADFISFDPRLPDGLRLFTVRMQRNEERIRQIESEVSKFNEEVEGTITELRKRVKDTPVLKMDDSPAPPIDDWAAAFEQITAQEGMTP